MGDFKTPTQYPDMGDYKGWTRLLSLAAYPSTVGYLHIRRFPCTRAPRPCTRKLPISPWNSDPTDQQARIWANPKERQTATSSLALLLLIQVIWMVKHKVEHVKIITHKLYASSYSLCVMILTCSTLCLIIHMICMSRSRARVEVTVCRCFGFAHILACRSIGSES